MTPKATLIFGLNPKKRTIAQSATMCHSYADSQKPLVFQHVLDKIANRLAQKSQKPK